MSVPEVRAGDLFELQRRSVPVAAGQAYQEIGLRSFGKGVFHKEPVDGVELGNKRVFYIESGDLLISNVFAWEGAVAVASDSEFGFIGSHRFMTWTRITGEIDTRYVFHYLSSERGITALGVASPGSAGRNRTLSVRNFENLLIPLPHIDEQRAIADRLDSAAHVAEISNDDADQLREALNSLHSVLFRDPHKLVTLGELLHETKRFEPLEPASWYSSAGVKWYSDGVFARESKPGNEFKSKQLNRLRAGEFIYNRLFAWKGSFALVPDQTLFASNEFPTFSIDEARIMPEYLLGWFSLTRTWDEVSRLSTGATTTSRNRFKQEQLLRLQIPLPSLEVQQELVATIRILKHAHELNSSRARVAKALPQAARNAEFARLLS